MKIKSIPYFRIFTYSLIFYLSGVLLSSFCSLNFYRIWPIFLILILFQIIIIFIFKLGLLGNIIAICSLALFLGIISFSYQNTKLDQQQLPFLEDKIFSAMIISYPEKDSRKQSFFIITDQFTGKKKIYIKTARYPEYNYGDKVIVSGKIEKPDNYSDFDWINYLKRFGSIASISNPEINLESSDNGNIVISNLYKTKQKIESIIDKNLPEPENSLAKGILVGSREGFSDDLLDQFNRAGITHIIALSGFNVTIIVVFISSLLLGIVGRRKNLVFSAVFIILFVIMTGASASIIRAAIISLILAYGTTIGRRADKANLLLSAACAMVIINPFILRFDTGFQLSFLAYFGLVYFSEIILKIFNWGRLQLVPKTIQLILAETFSAQIIVLPLLLTTFGRISIIAPISNLLILPIIPLSMLFVFISIIIYLVLPPLGHILFLVSYLLLKYVILISGQLSKLPLSSINITNDWQIILLVIYILSISLIYRYIKVKWQKVLKT